jgi:hypothetical protein
MRKTFVCSNSEKSKSLSLVYPGVMHMHFDVDCFSNCKQSSKKYCIKLMGLPHSSTARVVKPFVKKCYFMQLCIQVLRYKNHDKNNK